MPAAIPYVVAAAAVAATAASVENYEASQSAAAAQKDLAASQAKRLLDEQNARSAQAAQQAMTGSTFGFADPTHKAVMTGFGFGTAPAGSPNSGRGQITGMG